MLKQITQQFMEFSLEFSSTKKSFLLLIIGKL